MPAKRPANDTRNLREIVDYEHSDKTRYNIPPVGMAQYDTVASPEAKYEYDPNIDPSLEWAGKKEGTSFEVPTTSIHIHEVIKPYKIIHTVQTLGDDYKEEQPDLFESDVERAKRKNDSIEFYQHKNQWTNRLVAGDSLVIMNSMLQKEGMAGQVQMVYIDPPYGIKYGSNFQPFVNKRDVKDKKDDDLSTEPEMIKAFRDTWELGIHSYLTYLRDRLLLARELLSETGSVFVQISDENVHLVRNICDEIFGVENFVSIITVRKTGAVSSPDARLNTLGTLGDFIVWYAKDKGKVKYHQLFVNKINSDDVFSQYNLIEKDGNIKRLSFDEIKLLNEKEIMEIIQSTSVESNGYAESFHFAIEVNGKKYYPAQTRHWSTTEAGMNNLVKANRILVTENKLRYKRKLGDFSVTPIGNIWTDLMGASNLIYVVQTNEKIVARCLLMTTDPGDLVLDITCGSGTTAYVAEQWGRRWITCDTSRIAITLAKKRLMTATFDYYKIRSWNSATNDTNKSNNTNGKENTDNSFVSIRENIRDIRGNNSFDDISGRNNNPSNGFVYKTVSHVTLKSIANNEPAEQETLYDQPEIEKRKIRISGPFTVEALPAPVVMPLADENTAPAPFFYENAAKKQSDWMAELKASGILGRQKDKLEFSRVEPLEGTKYLHAEAETIEKEPKRAVICFAGETRPLDTRMVTQAMNETESIRPKPAYIIFAAFQFDPNASKYIEETKWPGLVLLKAQMNPDLMTADLKKKSRTSQSFWLVGQPDVDLILIEKGKDKGKYKVKVNGFDYYDIKQGIVDSGDSKKIAMWMLDTDYDGMCIDPKQVFFPMEGTDEGWGRLAKTLKAEINPALIEKYRGTESLPFEVKDNTSIAVKIVDDRGIESMKVIAVTG